MMIAVCPQNRCEVCPDYLDSVCSNFAFDDSDDIREYRVVVIEPERGYLHIFEGTENRELTLPWRSSEWESIYLSEGLLRSEEMGCIVDAYPVGPYIVVFTKSSQNVLSHSAVPRLRSLLELKLLDELKDGAVKISRGQIPSRISLTDRLMKVKNAIQDYISEFIPEVNKVTRGRISQIVSHHTSILSSFIPILLDSEVEEVYVDRPDSVVYFDHHRLGRCLTKFSLELEDISKLITLLRLESNLLYSLKRDFTIFDAQGNEQASYAIEPSFGANIKAVWLF